MNSRMRNPGALILTYHHIADAETDPGVLSVSPRHFSEHLEVLRAEANPVRLTDVAVSGWADLPARPVAITLDDGYADNLMKAKPLLERHDVPATVFIAGAAGDDEPEFWWDELERLLLRPGQLPQKLALPVDGHALEYDSGKAAIYTEQQFRELRHWKVWEDPPTVRHALFQDLCPRMKAMSRPERQELMCALRASARPDGLPEHRRMTARDIAALPEGGLIEIGAHTATHCKLPLVPAEQQREEIRRNRSYLEEVSGAPVRGFSYPYGDYSAQTLAIVRDEGFDYACSVRIGNAQPASDRYLLPRHSIFDLDGDEFARWLSRAWNGESRQNGGA
jgi:peptidoglycan/xylan/chitin deacetylase (PgdA/CDA1 family)